MEFFSFKLNNQYVDSGLIPTPYVKGDLSIAHLLYADEVILFVKGTSQVAANVMMFLEECHRESGLSINSSKSVVLFSYCYASLENEIASILNFYSKQAL